jgi:hypothetical protein
MNPGIAVLFFVEVDEVGSVFVVVVKASPERSKPLLSVKKVFIGLEGVLGSSCDGPTNELLVISHLENEGCSGRKPADDVLEQICDVVVTPRLVALEPRKLELAGPNLCEPIW